MGNQCCNKFSTTRITPQSDSNLNIHPITITKQPENFSITPNKRRLDSLTTIHKKPTYSYNLPNEENLNELKNEKDENNQQSTISGRLKNENQSKSNEKVRVNTSSPISMKDMIDNHFNDIQPASQTRPTSSSSTAVTEKVNDTKSNKSLSRTSSSSSTSVEEKHDTKSNDSRLTFRAEARSNSSPPALVDEVRDGQVNDDHQSTSRVKSRSSSSLSASVEEKHDAKSNDSRLTSRAEARSNSSPSALVDEVRDGQVNDDHQSTSRIKSRSSSSSSASIEEINDTKPNENQSTSRTKSRSTSSLLRETSLTDDTKSNYSDDFGKSKLNCCASSLVDFFLIEQQAADQNDFTHIVVKPDPSVAAAKDDRSIENPNGHVKLTSSNPDAFNSSFLQKRQAAIDKHAYRTTVESWSPKTLQQLEGLIQNFTKDKPIIDQHWIIFYWIARNIEYDAVSFLNGTIPSQTVENVFNTKKSVCEGYSRLYKHLCNHIKIPCEKISGYAKGFGFRDGSDTKFSKTNHAWNAVQIDEHWYLLDSTWGTGHLNTQNQFARELNTFYFLVRSEQMIYSHLPEEDRWQLLREPISKKQFGQMPQLEPYYFQLDIELIKPLYQSHAFLEPDKGFAVILIRSPPSVELSGRIELNGKEVEGGERLTYEETKQLYTCCFAPSSIGKHQILVFGKNKNLESTSSNSLMRFPLNVTKLPSKPISFPKTYSSFRDLGLQVISPVDTYFVKVNDKVTHACITIEAPADVALLGRLESADGEEIDNGHHIYFDRQKQLWICRFAPSKDGLYKALVFAKKSSDSGNYNSAVSFKIEATRVPQPPMSFPDIQQAFYDLRLELGKSKEFIKSQMGGECKIRRSLNPSTRRY